MDGSNQLRDRLLMTKTLFGFFKPEHSRGIHVMVDKDRRVDGDFAEVCWLLRSVRRVG